MQSIQQLAGRIRLGKPVGSPTLFMVPVTRETPSLLRYEPLQAALASKTLHITELGGAGSVTEVRVVNDGVLPVLLLDGAALVGAKQNRIINLTVLVPARSQVVVPVSCVEQGRWRAESREFTEGKSLHFAAARAEKLRDVSDSLARHGRARSDQGKVWADMATYSRSFGAIAPSGAMEDVYLAVEDPTERIIEDLRPVEGQVGAAFVNNNALLGMDLFDSASTFSAEFSKIVRSYGVEAIMRRQGVGVEPEAHIAAQVVANRLWENLVADQWESYPGVGLGTDLRLRTRHLAAGALICEDEVVHLAAFPGFEAERSTNSVHAPRMPRFRGRQ